MAPESLKICLLSYRGNPRSGGQGIYVRLLSRALVELGHEVDVWSGQPYPELLDGVSLTKVPSLDLWNEQDFLRTPSLRELSDPINFAEWANTKTGGFPEPLTFSRRVARHFKRGEMPHYDVVHDNQCLGPGLLALQEHMPVVATVHHPVTVDRRIAFQNTDDSLKRFGLKRFYSFLPTQLKVSRRLERVMTVSDASLRDVSKEYGVQQSRMRVVGNGINLDVFHPAPCTKAHRREPEQLITTLSADSPLKGFRFLLEALHELRKARPGVRLKVIGKPGVKTDTESHIRRLGIGDAIEFTGFVEDKDIARCYGEASVAVVPSLYEGFGFPAGEAMACEVPVVSSAGGALPEVVGTDGSCGLLVPPRNGKALAAAIGELLDAPERRAAMGAAGRRRVLEHFTWKRAAERTADVYREVIEQRERTRRAAC
ncbi:MAG: glycosyltransferase family 4 protein [Myxococcales bacterium]|nr:glycosyltransferase family 4 protein [Myxococcales bacterium]